MKATSLTPYLHLRSSSPSSVSSVPPDDDDNESENSKKLQWMFSNSKTCGRCHAIRPQVRLLRAIKKNLDKHKPIKYSQIIPDQVGWDALGSDLQQAFIRIFKLCHLLRAMPIERVLKKKADSMLDVLEHLLSHLPFPHDITETINLSKMNHPQTKAIAPYLFGWKLKEVIRLLRNVHYSKFVTVLPAYFRAEVIQADRISYSLLNFAVHEMRNSSICHSSLNSDAEFVAGMSTAPSIPQTSVEFSDTDSSGSSIETDFEEELPVQQMRPKRTSISQNQSKAPLPSVSHVLKAVHQLVNLSSPQVTKAAESIAIPSSCKSIANTRLIRPKPIGITGIRGTNTNTVPWSSPTAKANTRLIRPKPIGITGIRGTNTNTVPLSSPTAIANTRLIRPKPIGIMGIRGTNTNTVPLSSPTAIANTRLIRPKQIGITGIRGTNTNTVSWSSMPLPTASPLSSQSSSHPINSPSPGIVHGKLLHQPILGKFSNQPSQMSQIEKLDFKIPPSPLINSRNEQPMYVTSSSQSTKLDKLKSLPVHCVYDTVTISESAKFTSSNTVSSNVPKTCDLITSSTLMPTRSKDSLTVVLNTSTKVNTGSNPKNIHLDHVVQGDGILKSGVLCTGIKEKPHFTNAYAVSHSDTAVINGASSTTTSINSPQIHPTTNTTVSGTSAAVSSRNYNANQLSNTQVNVSLLNVGPNVDHYTVKPTVKGTRLSNGIVIKWHFPLEMQSQVEKYVLHYSGINQMIGNFRVWKKIGEIKPLPMPMCITLTNTNDEKSIFALKAVYINGLCSQSETIVI